MTKLNIKELEKKIDELEETVSYWAIKNHEEFLKEYKYGEARQRAECRRCPSGGCREYEKAENLDAGLGHLWMNCPHTDWDLLYHQRTHRKPSEAERQLKTAGKELKRLKAMYRKAKRELKGDDVSY